MLTGYMPNIMRSAREVNEGMGQWVLSIFLRYAQINNIDLNSKEITIINSTHNAEDFNFDAHFKIVIDKDEGIIDTNSIKEGKIKKSQVGTILDSLKVNRYCCRRMFLGQVDLIDVTS